MDAEQRRKLVWYAAALLLIAALAVVGWRYGRPAYRHYKETRSIAQARAFFEKTDYRNGLLSLQLALAVNPRSVEATHLMAALLAEANSPAALTWWRRLVELEPTLANQLDCASYALRAENPPFPIASQIIEGLQPAAQTNTTYHMMAMQLAMRLNRVPDAESHLQAAIRLEPTNRLYQLNLAVLRLQSRDSTLAEAARRDLAGFEADAVLGGPALRSLVTDAFLRGSMTEAETLSQKLLAMPKATFEDRVQHLTVLEKAKDPDLPAWTDRLRQEASTNLMRVGLVAVWLNSHDRSQEAVSWLQTLPESLHTNPPLSVIEAEGRVASSDWSGLEAQLTRQSWGDHEFMRLALLARALREQGRRELADAHWRRAVGAARSQVGLLSALAQVAGRWDWNEEKENVLWAIGKSAPHETWVWQTLLRARNEAGDTAGVLRIYSAMLEQQPDSDASKNNFAIIALLLNREVEKSVALARQAYARNQTNAAYVSTYAFALHRQGQTQEGLRLMQTLPEESLKKPDIALYYAVLLSAGGQRDKAAPFIAAAEQGKMLPEERRLLDAAKAD